MISIAFYNIDAPDNFFRLRSREINNEKTIGHRCAHHLHAIDEQEAFLELPRRNAAMEIDAAFVVRLPTTDDELVFFQGHIELIAGEPGHRQSDAQKFWLCVRARHAFNIIGRITVGCGLRDAFQCPFEFIESDEERRGQSGHSCHSAKPVSEALRIRSLGIEHSGAFRPWERYGHARSILQVIKESRAVTAKIDILAIGEPMVEFNEDRSGPTPLYRPGHGGDTSNAIIAAARQGARTAYFTHLGDDAFGRQFLDLWDQEHVDRTHVKLAQGQRTGVYFVTHGPDGHEFSYYRAGSAASLVTSQDLPKGLVESAEILHVSGISQAISVSACDMVFEAMARAETAGRVISYDTNLRLRLWQLERARAIIHAAASKSTILLPGLDDARQLTGLESADAICDFYLALGPSLVALTMGKDGTLVATREARRHIPARVVKAVDTTGAGDTFDGAFLAEWVKTRDAFAAAHFANAAAALSTQGYGAVAPIPRRAVVESFMAN